MDHSQDCKAVINENIIEFLKRHQSIMMSLNTKIIEFSEEITNFVNHENKQFSSRFLKFISTLKKFEMFTEHLDQEEEQK